MRNKKDVEQSAVEKNEAIAAGGAGDRQPDAVTPGGADGRRTGVMTGVLICVALFMGVMIGTYVLPNLTLPWAAARDSVLGDARVKAADVQDGNGKFVILDYPEYDAAKYVTLPDYGSMTVEAEQPPEITEEDIEENIKSYIVYNDACEAVTEGTVHKGDVITVTYSAAYEGEDVAALSATDSVIELGSAGEPQDFVDVVDGSEIGKVLMFDVTFPDDWSASDWAGKTVQFTVTVTQRNDFPELTDEFVSSLTDGEYGNEAELREYVRQTIEDYDAAVYDEILYNAAMDALLEQSKFKTVPQDLIDWYVSVQMKYFQDYADMYGMTVEEYVSESGLDMTVDEMLQAMAAEAVENVKINGILTALADAEGITVDAESDADRIKARQDELMEGLGIETEDVLLDYYKQSNIYNDVRNLKTVDWICDNIKSVAPADGDAD